MSQPSPQHAPATASQTASQTASAPAPLILPYQGAVPRIHRSAYIAPGATIIGDVTIGPESSVFYGCVLRGDVGPIRIGARTNIQDNCVLHVDSDSPCVLGDDVTVGHLALVHGTTVGNGCLIGMHAALLSRSRVGAGSLIAAGSVVLEGQEIPPGSLAAGVPASVRRSLDDASIAGFRAHAGRYVTTASQQAGYGEALSLEDVQVDEVPATD